MALSFVIDCGFFPKDSAFIVNRLNNVVNVQCYVTLYNWR